MYLNGIEIKKGEKRKINLTVAGTDIKIHFYVVCGKEEGKTLAITAGMHGCEYVGIRTAQNLIGCLNPNEIKGNVIIFPVLNPDGFYYGEKGVFLQDKKNLNRIFPGNADGTYTEKVAYLLETFIFTISDFLLDLHSGDVNENIVSHVYFPYTENKTVLNLEKEAMQSLSCNFCVEAHSKNSFCGYGANCGVPSLLLEVGGLGLWNKKVCDSLLKDIFSVMGYLNILGRQNKNDNQVTFTSGVYENSLFNGFWYPFVTVGEEVYKGMLLGEIRDIDDVVLQSVFSEANGMVLYYTVSLGVSINSPIIAYGIR